MTRIYLGLFSLIIAVVIIPGCYTMIEHPEVVSTSSEYAHVEKIRFYEDCQSCHSSEGTEYVKAENYIREDDNVSGDEDTEIIDNRTGGRPPIIITEPYAPISYYGGSYGYYYSSPWWYSSGNSAGKNNSADKTRERESRTAGRNDGGRAPSSGGRAPSGGGTTPPPAAPVTRAPAGSNGNSGSTSTSTQQGSGSTTDSNSSNTRTRSTDSNSGSNTRNDGGRSSGGRR